MKIEIKAPAFPESVADGEVSLWHKQEGDFVQRDELLVEIETDKVVMEVVAPEAGRLDRILVDVGSTIESDALLAELTPGEATDSAEASPAEKTAEKAEAPVPMGPAARQLVDEHGLDASAIKGTGKDGRINKEDVLAHLAERAPAPAPQPTSNPVPPSAAPASTDLQGPTSERIERRVPMTRMRARIAERLLSATQQTAMLTTFNEVDMTNIVEMRKENQDDFQKRYGIKLGFMSFFIKASVVALKNFPAVNAEIEGSEIVYKNYYNISIAVGTDKGLVVPVVKNSDELSFADIEKNINMLGQKARDGKITIEDLQGGTFTITNGGIYGSMLSTPILNPPQSAVLGMHNIIERPIVSEGEIKIRPMMYLALSYDHRIIDGKEAVSFLKIVKDSLEQPKRLFLNL